LRPAVVHQQAKTGQREQQAGYEQNIETIDPGHRL
jgi:hypothetical protein